MIRMLALLTCLATPQAALAQLQQVDLPPFACQFTIACHPGEPCTEVDEARRITTEDVMLLTDSLQGQAQVAAPADAAWPAQLAGRTDAEGRAEVLLVEWTDFDAATRHRLMRLADGQGRLSVLGRDAPLATLYLGTCEDL